MIKNIRLDRFIFYPRNGIRKAINFERQAVIFDSKLTNHDRHVLTDSRMISDITLNISAKNPNVGHSPAVNQLAGIKTTLQIVLFDFLLALRHKILDQHIFLETIAHFGIDKFNRPHIDQYGTLY